MESDNKLKIKNVETYTEDMVKVLEGDKSGLIKKIIQEEEAHEARNRNLSPGSKKNRVYMMLSSILLLLALAILVFLAFFYENQDVVTVAPQSASIIFTDLTNFRAVDGLNKDSIVQVISNQINNTKVKIGGVEGIYLTESKKVIGLDRFMTLMKGSLVDENNFISDNFLLGAFNSGLKSTSPNAGDPFILLRIRSFTDALPVMLNWEKKMLYDLNGFFGISITPETNYLFTKDWEDGIISNKNARILKNKDGGVVLMYVFMSDSSVIVTNSEVATAEITRRIASSQIKK